MRIRAFALCLAFVSLAAAGPAPASGIDFSAPGGGSIDLQTDPGNRAVVRSQYWRLEFDLRNGGVLDTIVFLHGSGQNLLLQPLVTSVGPWSDRNAPAVTLDSSRQGNLLRLEFSGRLAAVGRQAGPVAFRTVWTISPFMVRADHTLVFSQEVPTATLSIGSTTVRRDLDEYGVRVGPADDPNPGHWWPPRDMVPATLGKVQDEGGAFVDQRHAPLYLLLFHRDLEGFDLTTASDLETWELGLTGRPGLGRYSAALAGDGIQVTRQPLNVRRPVNIHKGEYTFSYYLGLPRIVEKSERKWRHISFGNHPWPSDADIAHWADSGVNIARLHNDYELDENFWHDGAWPPYDAAGMAEMRRVIATCHKYGIKVVPYFSIHEFHPTAPGYKEHEAEWARTVGPPASVHHNHMGKGEYGAQMCPMSGWLDRRKHDIEQAYRELGFDGIYFDWVMELPCDNRQHNPKLHLGTDGVIDLLAWTRRLIQPQGTLIVHIYGLMPSIAFENFADLVVNMEENSEAESMMRMSQVPLVTVLAESIPRSPCPSYRADQALERNRNNISQFVVLGMFPWAGYVSDAVSEATLQLFRAFKPYKLEDFLFRNTDSGVVRTGWDDVYGALYAKDDLALVVVSNTSPEPRQNIVVRVQRDALAFHSARLSVTDTRTRKAVSVDAKALADGSLVTQLEGYEYRILELRPQP
ncbi:MAG: DUF6259 domain-containing protein [Bryobacteraceae bacterium]